MASYLQTSRAIALAMAALIGGSLSVAPAAAQSGGPSTGPERSEALNSQEAEYDPQVRVCPDGKYESGCDREDIFDAIAIDREIAPDLALECLFQTSARCSPLAFGAIAPTSRSGTIAWQKMEIFPKDGPRIEMLVLIESQDDEPTNVLVARQTEGWYGIPDLIENDDRLLLIHAPGRTGGTGAGNVDVVLTKHAMGWTTFDVNTYLEQAEYLLPKGFELGRGATFNFREMHASVPVRRPLDGGCCATGGMVYIDLGLPRPNWMQVDSITFEEMTPVKTHHIDATENIAEYEEEDGQQ